MTQSPLAPSSQPWTWCQLWFTFLFIPRSAQAAMLQAAGRPLQHLHPMTLGRTPGHISLAIHHITIIIVSTLDESRNTLTPLTVPCVHRAQLASVEPGDLTWKMLFVLQGRQAIYWAVLYCTVLYCRADRSYIGPLCALHSGTLDGLFSKWISTMIH